MLLSFDALFSFAMLFFIPQAMVYSFVEKALKYRQDKSWELGTAWIDRIAAYLKESEKGVHDRPPQSGADESPQRYH